MALADLRQLPGMFSSEEHNQLERKLKAKGLAVSLKGVREGMVVRKIASQDFGLRGDGATITSLLDCLEGCRVNSSDVQVARKDDGKWEVTFRLPGGGRRQSRRKVARWVVLTACGEKKESIIAVRKVGDLSGSVSIALSFDKPSDSAQLKLYVKNDFALGVDHIVYL